MKNSNAKVMVVIWFRGYGTGEVNPLPLHDIHAPNSPLQVVAIWKLLLAAGGGRQTPIVYLVIFLHS